MDYQIKEVSSRHLVIEFDYIGFIEYWNGNDTIYSNIFEGKGIDRKGIKKIRKIFRRTLLLYKLGLLRRR